ncbi:hypothetical protein C8Q75DRAFT_760139 [Abortiporus biennis]|nr:hypothetical protein C8Q75DRAFT_760139 [Abortiporus biennis]
METPQDEPLPSEPTTNTSLRIVTVGQLVPKSTMEEDDNDGYRSPTPHAHIHPVPIPPSGHSTPLNQSPSTATEYNYESEQRAADPEIDAIDVTSSTSEATYPDIDICADTPPSVPPNQSDISQPLPLDASEGHDTSSIHPPGRSTDLTDASDVKNKRSETQTLRIKRSAYVPAWAVPPRVLLVDDDAINRKKSSKFLQIFGCTIDVAVDGLGAVEQMNIEKYDLVLMDIMMPRLDGVSATSLIRRFDSVTPIISMTSNSEPHEVLTYFSTGMNDILPKPFTPDGLLDMVEKHLVHLKVMETISRLSKSPPSQSVIPRSLTVSPPLIPDNDEDDTSVSLASSSKLTISLSLGNVQEQHITPMDAAPLDGEQYTTILKNVVEGRSSPVRDSLAATSFSSLPSAASITGGKKRALSTPSSPTSSSDAHTHLKKRKVHQ